MKKALYSLVLASLLGFGALAPAWAQPRTTEQPNMTSQMGQMDEHMKKMQALHDQMLSASTPKERQRVMDEQRKEMQGCMAMMKPMMQGGAMMEGKGPDMMGQSGKPADAKAQMQMMQKRMDMMHMMMQAMMDQQGMMGSPESLDAAPKK